MIARIIAALVFSAALAAPPALAAGLNLRWNDCRPGSSRALYSDCASDSGAVEMVGSFVMPVSLQRVNGFDVVIDIEVCGPTLPDWWWMFDPGTCRETALSAEPRPGPADTACAAVWGTRPVLGGIAWYRTHWTPGAPTPAPNLVRIILAYGSEQMTANLTAGREYFAFRLRMGFERTTGPDACGGCGIPVRIVLNQITLSMDTGEQVPISDVDWNRLLLWQTDQEWGVPYCPTPTRRETWGGIKTRYR